MDTSRLISLIKLTKENDVKELLDEYLIMLKEGSRY